MGLSLLTELVLACICFYGFGLFLWWWIKKGSASPVYCYVTFLLLGIGIRTIMDMIIEQHISNCNESIINGLFWNARLLVCLLSSSAIVLHMSYRAFFQNTKCSHYINPLTIYCRLFDLCKSYTFSKKVGIFWEKILNCLKKWEE